MLSRLEFIIAETFLGLRRHPGMAFAAIACVTVALFAAGIVGLAILNAQHLVDSTIQRVSINVYFHPETTRKDAKLAVARLEKLSQVREVEFVPREDGWARFVKEMPEIQNYATPETLPDSALVKVDDLQIIPVLKTKLQRWAEVDKVVDVADVQMVLLNMREAVSRVGTVLGIILIFLSLVIIHHTIELTLYARRKEIHIMTLVGATPSTVALPFLLEGMLYGILGGAVAIATLCGMYLALLAFLREHFQVALLGTGAPEMINGALAVLVAGLGLGLIGSIISITKFLRSPRSKITNA